MIDAGHLLDYVRDRRKHVEPSAETPKEGDKQLTILRGMLEQMPGAMLFANREGVIKWINPAGAELLGSLTEEVLRTDLFDLFVKRDRTADGEHIKHLLSDAQQIRGLETFIIAGGARRAVSVNMSLYRSPSGDIMGIIATLVDVNELVFKAYHDMQTGLMNAGALKAATINEVVRARATGSSFGLVVLNLDDSKHRNDIYGIAVVDGLLKGVAEVLGHLAGFEMVGRSRDDEFVVLVRGDAQLVDDLAHRLQIGLKNMKNWHADLLTGQSLPLSTTASIGWALISDVPTEPPASDADAADLIRSFADLAMREAKQEKNRIVRFTVSLNRMSLAGR